MHLILEFSRPDDTENPFAVPDAEQAYQARERGGGMRAAALPWADIRADLASMDGDGDDDGDGPAGPGDPAVRQRLGDRLRGFLLGVGWERHEPRIIEAVEAGEPVRITIRSTAAELYALPWGLATVGKRRQHLHELSGVLLRYEWPETSTAVETPMPRGEGGRILVAWSAALGGVPAAGHLNAIGDACAAGGHEFDRGRDVLERASLDGLRRALADTERGPVAVLHLLCHGERQGAGFALGLDAGGDVGTGGAAGPALVDAARLRQVLAPFAGHLRLVVLSVCDGGNPGAIGNHLGSVAENLHRVGIQAVIASRVPLDKRDSVELCRGLYGPLLREPASVEAALLSARADLATNASSAAWASLQMFARDSDGWDTRPIVIRPYRGLLPFTAAHARFFRGRDAERRAVRDKLEALRAAGAPRFVVVAGASGRGKSSLVRGGVAPALACDGWQVAEMRPGAHPGKALDELLAGGLGDAAGAEGTTAGTGTAAPKALLVIDQFDELFTHTTDPAERRAFVQRVWSLCARPDGRLHCVITVRVDFLGDCGELTVGDVGESGESGDSDNSGRTLERVAYDDAHTVFVAQMARADLQASIVEPAGMVGVGLQDGLVQRILDDVEGEPGPLPLVQYTLDLLWHQRAGGALSMAAYDDLGGDGQSGVRGALQTRADELIDGLDEPQTRQARRLLVRLVSLQEGRSRDTHRRMTRAELAPHDDDERAAFASVVDALVDARLIVRSELDGQPALDVAHEALIREWPRLRKWLSEDRHKLAEIQELERWEKQWRDLGALLQGARLGYAVRVREKYSQDLGAGALELIRASEAQAGARAASKRRAVIAVVSGALLVAVIIGVLAVRERRQTRKAERETEKATAALTTAADLSRGVILDIERGMQDYAYPGLADLRKSLLADTQKLHKTLLAAAPGHAGLLRSKLMAHKRRGDLAHSHDDLTVARTEYEAALDIARKLEHGPDGRQDLSIALDAMGVLSRKEGDLQDAHAFFQQSLDIIREVAQQDPDNAAVHHNLSVSYNRLGDVELDQGDFKNARSSFQQSLDIMRKVAQQDPDNAAVRRELFVSYGRLGEVARAEGDFKSARAFFQQSFDIIREVAQQDPDNAAVRRDLAMGYNRLGDVAREKGDFKNARSFFQQSLNIIREVVQQDPDNTAARRQLSGILNDLGDAEREKGDFKNARSFFQQSLNIINELSTLDPNNIGWLILMAKTHANLGIVAWQDNDMRAFRAHVKSGKQIVDRLSQDGKLETSADLTRVRDSFETLARMAAE